MSTIDVEGLQRELEEQRRAREASSIPTAFNVVAFVEDDAELTALIRERIEQLEKRNPLRSILLMTAKPGPVTMEHVELDVRNLAAPQLHSIVHDLIVPAVRTVLLWAGQDVTDPRFAALGSLADVIITFTSRTATSESKTLADLVAMQNTPLGPKLRDLAFLRLGAWQDLVAEFFDDAELTPELERLEHIDVFAGTRAEAYYFIGWLASRLNWQPCGKHEFCNAAGQSVGVTIKKKGPARRLASVALKSKDVTFEAQVQSGNDDIVCLQVHDHRKRPQRCVPLNETDVVSLIERAIFFPPDNNIYAETLAMVGRLLQHVE